VDIPITAEVDIPITVEVVMAAEDIVTAAADLVIWEVDMEITSAAARWEGSTMPPGEWE